MHVVKKKERQKTENYYLILVLPIVTNIDINQLKLYTN